jgi:energy-coupling factor transporter ATP-binding protein EcfA2
VTQELPEEDETPTGPPLLARFAVDRLYGKYSYDIKVPQTSSGLSRLVLLHGDNGCGKTSLLRLLWHTLSPADNRGHRSELAQIPFASLSMNLTDQTQITARKKDGLVGSFDLIIERPNMPDLIGTFRTNERGRVPGPARALARQLEEYDNLEIATSNLDRTLLEEERRRAGTRQFIQELKVNPVFLADDRRLYVDDPALQRQRERYAESEGEREGRVNTPGTNDVVADELRITLRRVSDWLRTLALRGQNVGQAGAHTIYRDVLERLAVTGEGPAQIDSREGTNVSVERLLADLKVRSPRFEKYDLIPHFDASGFETLLARIGGDRKRLAHDIIIPYLETLSARCDALEEAEQRLTALLNATNEFLIGKSLSFSARTRHGLRIVTDDGATLDPLQLSSGERQLAMLVCTTLLAGRDARLFLIDEPELSLGVTWQRKVLESLLSLTMGSPLQFIVATHSIEVISSQLDSLVPLSR